MVYYCGLLRSGHCRWLLVSWLVIVGYWHYIIVTNNIGHCHWSLRHCWLLVGQPAIIITLLVGYVIRVIGILHILAIGYEGWLAYIGYWLYH